MQLLSQHHTAIDLVLHFRERRALVIGDALLDSYLEGEAARLSRDGPIPVVRKTTEQRIPGGAANVVANLRALEAQVTFLSVIGHDSAGALLRAALQERGIDDQWLLEDPSACTPHKLRILSDGQHIARIDEGGLSPIPSTLECQQQLLTALDTLYSKCEVVILSDYCYGVVSDALLERLQMLSHASPKVILVDSQDLQRFRHFPATVVTPNYVEAMLLAKEMGAYCQRSTPTQGPEQFEAVEDLGRHILSYLATEYVAITLAEQGVALVHRQAKTQYIPVHPVEAPHDVGAGDSFASAFALALAAHGEIEESARIGVDAAGIAVTKPRTAVVSHQELLQRVSLRVYTAQAHEYAGEGAREALQKLRAQLEAERLLGPTIVFTNGVFDILHVGHIEFLRQAKSLGDILVVAVNSDRSARRLKGPGRPINNERDRLALVSALDMVNHALLFEADTSDDLLRQLHPHIFVKGGDYTNETLPEAEVLQEIEARLVLLPLAGSMSTSDMIDRIRAAT
jgi:D-beta-D-heptose 7-phosphate kinase / D-beta-D-heptose 1-phosphate adenosyltransferase